MTIAYDTRNRELLSYEIYPGSMNDMSQFQYTVEKAKGYGYKKIGFVFDRGYFSKDNIYHLEDSGYSFVMMLEGKADLVQKWVLLKKTPFMTKESIHEFYEKKLKEYLDSEFEEYCTCDDYYEPVVEDFELIYDVEHRCKENGFEIISCEGDGSDGGYEPKFRRGW